MSKNNKEEKDKEYKHELEKRRMKEEKNMRKKPTHCPCSHPQEDTKEEEDCKWLKMRKTNKEKKEDKENDYEEKKGRRRKKKRRSKLTHCPRSHPREDTKEGKDCEWWKLSKKNKRWEQESEVKKETKEEKEQAS